MKIINYFGDSRYEKIWEQMQLHGIQEVTSRTKEKKDKTCMATTNEREK